MDPRHGRENAATTDHGEEPLACRAGWRPRCDVIRGRGAARRRRPRPLTAHLFTASSGRVLATIAVAVLAFGLSACGDTGQTPPGGSGQRGAAGTPAVTVSHGSTALELLAYTACYDSMCADGMPPASPPDVGSPPEVKIAFPLPDWSFTAIFQPANDPCGRTQTVPVERTDDGTFVLRPVGYADTYDVTLFGRGNGDLFTMFRWSTPTDGPLPTPEVTLAVVAGHDGQVDSYGIELVVSNLATTPRAATATITVTAANREQMTFTPTRPPKQQGGCDIDGNIYWDGPDERGKHAARLGPAPFIYDVVLTLDGARYKATAEWPADLIKGKEPSVALNFHPPLPSLK